MNWGDFRQHFRGFAWKRLTPHEVDARVSHGHEFQGVGRLRQILGTEAAERLPTKFVLLHEDTDDVEAIDLWSKWYDARANNPDRSAEWRLYYPAEAEAIQSQMRAGDLMVIAVTQQRELLILLAPVGSDRERQLELLFGITEEAADGLQVRALDAALPMDFVTATILEQLGLGRIEPPSGGDSAAVAQLIERLAVDHPEQLPAGVIVASLVRTALANVDPVGAPDEALYRWIEAEAAIYRGWEDRKIAARLRRGFILEGGDADVDSFRVFSMALRQSRVSRAGGALQYHIRELLDAHRLEYVMEPKIDGGELPDFLFPSEQAYNDASYPADRLRMLAAKYTAKDRWRQVLNEAERIPNKHLLTLEAAITTKQIDLMQRAKLTLVIPAAIRARYSAPLAARISKVSAFFAELKSLQR